MNDQNTVTVNRSVSSGNASEVRIASTPSTTASTVTTNGISFVERKRHARLPPERVAGAVLSHLKALRALGKNEVNVAEISGALGISESAVAAVVPALVRKGAKVK